MAIFMIESLCSLPRHLDVNGAPAVLICAAQVSVIAALAALYIKANLYIPNLSVDLWSNQFSASLVFRVSSLLCFYQISGLYSGMCLCAEILRGVNSARFYA